MKSKQAKTTEEQTGFFIEGLGSFNRETEMEIPGHEGQRFYYCISHIWPKNTQTEAAKFLKREQPTISHWCASEMFGPKRKAATAALKEFGINVLFIYDKTGKEPLLLEDREKMLQEEGENLEVLKDQVIKLVLENQKQEKTIKSLERKLTRFQATKKKEEEVAA